MNWDLQRQIWEHAIRGQLHLQPSEASLLVTEPVFNFPTCQEACLQVSYRPPACWDSVSPHDSSVLALATAVTSASRAPCVNSIRSCQASQAHHWDCLLSLQTW